jgi:arylsulfatase A-like enzyme
MCCLLMLTVGMSEEATPPNLIVIMADDLGYADVGFNGCKDIPTPNIDKIAQDGVIFTSGYTTYSVCGPSRAGFITGRYQGRFGCGRNPQYQPDDPNMGLPKSEKTLATVLKPKGYHSGIIGKWHLGAHKETHHPLNRGFDEFFGHLGGGHQYFSKMLTIKDSYSVKSESESYRTWIMRNHTPVKTEDYLTDEFSNEAVSFVERNASKPFFLFLSYNAPHGPLQATEKYLKRFPEISQKNRKTYAAMVSAVDDGVGRLIAKLKEEKLYDNTLVFFLSDNGGTKVSQGVSRNTPLRGKKSDVWEGGYRVPFAASWPKVIKKGTQYQHPVSSLDIFATIAGLTEAKIDQDRPLDGTNLIPYLTGEEKGVPHKNVYLRKFDQKRFAIRQGDFKLVKSAEAPELYNLSEDIGEKNNLIGQHKDVASKLKTEYEAWASQLKDPRFLGLIHRNDWKKK